LAVEQFLVLRDRRAGTAENRCQALRNAEAAHAQKSEGVKKEPTLAKAARIDWIREKAPNTLRVSFWLRTEA
jgi:hypothetical protein